MQTELNKVVDALKEFYARETHLLEKDLGERTLTHRLDYNRLGERTLRLPKGTIISTDDEIGKSVYPDIVVHQHEIPNNLLAIEVRKASNHQPREHEQHKLRALTDPHLWFAYRIGLFVTLAKKAVTSPEVYVGGVLDPHLSGWLVGRLRDVGLGAGQSAGQG